MLASIVLSLAIATYCAQAKDDSGSPIKIESLKDAAPFSSLTTREQSEVLRAIHDDIAEMAEIDVASSGSSRTAYRDYFIHHLQFKAVPGTASTEKLLLIRYNSNTMCGSYENCPVWIVRLTSNGNRFHAESMVPWQNEHLGTSAGGGWGVGVLSLNASDYPELILLTRLSSTQTGLACYRESKGKYLRVDCSPESAHLFEHRGG
jgi:hypothetical protein